MSDKFCTNPKSITGSSFSTEGADAEEFADIIGQVRRNYKNTNKTIKWIPEPKVKKEKSDSDDSSDEESKEDEAKKVVKSGTQIDIKLTSKSGPPIGNSGDPDNGNDPENSNDNDPYVSFHSEGEKISIVFKKTLSPQGKKGKKIAKEIGLFALKTAAISVAILGGTALIVPALGFGALGVTGGSLAAIYQSSFLGGTIASGSAFATLQSIGMAGLSAATQGAIVAGSAATSGAHSIFKMSKEKSKKG